MAGRLFVVATPIGNLADISARAAEVLRTVPVVACEDTRRSRPLLVRLGATPRQVLALHDHNESAASAAVLGRLRQGEDVALVCDAGTPLVADPGFELLRLAFAERMDVTPIPGPSAVTAAVAASPIPVDRFRFEGFLPAKAAPRRKTLSGLLAADAATVFFEAPHRLRQTLGELAALGGQQRPLLLCRELTKAYEPIAFAPVAEHLDKLPPSPRGEFTGVLAPVPKRAAPSRSTEDAAASAEHAAENAAEAKAVLRALCAELPAAQAARLGARITGHRREELYALAVSLRGERE